MRIVSHTATLATGTQSGSCTGAAPSVATSQPSVSGSRASATMPYSGVSLAIVSIVPESGKKRFPRNARMTSEPLAALTAPSVRNASPNTSPYSENSAAPASTSTPLSSQARSSPAAPVANPMT